MSNCIDTNFLQRQWGGYPPHGEKVTAANKANLPNHEKWNSNYFDVSHNTKKVYDANLLNSENSELNYLAGSTKPSTNSTDLAPEIVKTDKTEDASVGKDLTLNPDSTVEPAHKDNSEETRDVKLTKQERKLDIVWLNVIVFIIFHYLAIQGLVYIVTFSLYWQTFLFGLLCAFASGQGITAGNHRLWAHKTYKAKLPLQVMLCVFQTIALQNSVIEWSRDHRVHHRFTDTDADPHNSLRGFFFSHMGWLMCRKHPDVALKGKTVDMSDLESDPILAFQKKYYLILAPLFCWVLPSMIPVYFWGEDWYVALTTAGMFRYVLTLHFTWLVNSAAHMWGYKPYDTTINPAENKWVSFVTAGEGWHNYHHAFPWDYRARELDGYSGSFTTACIEFFAKIGWAYDLRVASDKMIEKRIFRTGDFEVYKARNSL